MANIELDGTNKKIKVDSGDLTLDVPGDIVLDADGGDITFADGGTNLLKITNSSSDVVFQPQVDTKDIVFKQYDGTVVATVEDNATFNVPTGKLAINGTAITSTAAELNILDGVTATASELNLIDGVTATTAELNILDGVTATAAEINLIDGGTARGTTAIADGDGVLINDAGTMRQTTVETLKTYIGGGGLVYIGGTSSTSEVSDFTVDNCFTSTYDNYIVKFGMTIVSGSNNTKLQMNFRTGGGSGSTESTSNYDRTGWFRDSQNSSSHSSDTGGSSYIMGFNALGNSDGRYTAEGTMQFFQPNSDTYYKTIITTAAGINWGGYTQTMDSICYHKSTTQMTGLVMHSTSGNLKFGWIKVYGVINS